MLASSPGYMHLSSFFLGKLQALMRREVNAVTTVIQFDALHPVGKLPVGDVPLSGTGANINMATTSFTGGADEINAVESGSLGGLLGAMGQGKPKSLETACKRLVECAVSIGQNTLFRDMIGVWVRVIIMHTSAYDVEAIFCLVDFIDMLLVEYGPRATSAQNEISPLIDVSLLHRMIRIVLQVSDHTISLLRIISFVYTHFPLLTSSPALLQSLVVDILLDGEIFTRLFMHWCRNVRVYYMRVLAWRVGRIGARMGIAADDLRKEEVVIGKISDDNRIWSPQTYRLLVYVFKKVL
ncbi:uncharacterized protein VTP21DRAFT_11378 [Calcarisporiella thermophila]|uniref:uncharacterized protein n=1 Tax=Calcarisporiella thermophila TaxID=911321 RepID=UPI0037432F3A